MIQVDWKSAKGGIKDKDALQQAAYAHAEWYDDNGVASFMPVIDLAVCVHLTPSGYSVVPVDISDEAYQTFLHVAAVSKAAKAIRGYVGKPLGTPDWGQE